MMEFDENGLYCKEGHERINFENWKEGEEHDINIHIKRSLITKIKEIFRW